MLMAEEGERRANPARVARNRRTEIEVLALADDDEKEYWEQEFWAELSEDGEFEEDSQEEQDEVDSDFDLPESADDQDEEEIEAGVRREERQERRRGGGGAYLDPGRQKRDKPPPRPRQAKAQRVRGDAARRNLRASTRSVSIAGSALRDERARADEQRRLRRRATAKKPEYPRLTQTQLLEEAAVTEQINIASLEAMSMVQETERKKRQTTKPKPTTGPRVVFRSTGDGNTLTFIGMPHVPGFGGCAPVTHTHTVCAVTGRPARYRDPLTGLPYADAQSFRVLRARHSAPQVTII